MIVENYSNTLTYILMLLVKYKHAVIIVKHLELLTFKYISNSMIIYAKFF